MDNSENAFDGRSGIKRSGNAKSLWFATVAVASPTGKGVASGLL
jgi:hypothetical protein